MAQTYLQQAAEKRNHQASLIPAEWRLDTVPSVEDAPNALDYIRSSNLLTDSEMSITETSDISILVRNLARGEISSLEVTKAFAKRTAISHQLTNCCTEIFFEEAFEEARRLDNILATTGKPVGPLHGLPVSVKDNIYVKGKDASLGWVGLVNKPSLNDEVVATVLRRLGAVLYVKTNVPQSLMMSDSYNHVFGQTVNPLDRNLISGGSSGGEATLIGARGSAFGIGTDIGGSIRIPAALCGLYGFMPTISRQPYERPGIKQRIVRSFAGPLASSLGSIETYMQALPYARGWELDAEAIPMPWRADSCSIPLSKKLKIGFIIDDGVVRPQPPIIRAMKEVIIALKDAGHEVIEWDATSHGYAYELWEKAILSDGGLGCKKLCELSGEPLIEGMLVGTDADILTTEQTHKLVSDKLEYETKYLRDWHISGLDALIMPVTPWVGYKPWTWVNSHAYVGYTSIWNLLDWAALAIPVTTVTKDADHDEGLAWANYQARSKSDQFNKDQYDIELVEGIPVAVQIVCGKYKDEKCIAVGKVIEALLNKKLTRDSKL